MLRKSIVFAFIIFFFLMLFQYGINFLKTEHSINYILTSSDKKFDITEVYKKNSNVNYYYFDLLYNDVHFLFEEDNVFNKQKQIVKSVESYDIDGVDCLNLIYINGEKSDLLCSKDKKVYSYIALKDEYDFTEIIKDKIIPNDKDSIDKYGMILYESYTYDDETLLFYDYKSILRYSPNGFLNSHIFSAKNDLETNYGVLINNLYVIPRITSSDGIYYYYVFNVETGAIFEIKSPVVLSFNLSNLGVYDDVLYVFDKDKLNEISIDVSKREIIHIGGKGGNGLIYKNNGLVEISIDEISKSNLMFEFSDFKGYENVKCDKIFKQEKFAIYLKDDVFYKVYPNALDNPIYLFSMKDAKEIIVKEDRVYFSVGNLLYRFDDNGIYTLAKKESLATDLKNSYDVYISK